MALTGLLLCTAIRPVAASPSIFSASESALPGDVIYLQGDFTASGTASTVYLYTVSGTESSLNTPPAGASTLTPVTSSSNAVTVRIPANIPLGLYAAWVGGSGGTSSPVYINKARAMSFEYGAISPGYPFRIFGRNLSLNGATPIVTLTGTTFSGTAAISGTYPNDSNVLQVIAPTNLPTSGTFTVNVSNGYGHVAAGTYDVVQSEVNILGRPGGPGAANDPFNLGVPWGYDFINIHNTMLDVTGSNSVTHHNYGADPTGVQDSTAAIQLALKDAGNTTYYPNGATVYMQPGNFVINKGTNTTAFVIPPNVVLMGSGTAATTITDNSPCIPSYSYLLTMTSGTGAAYGSYSGVQGFTCIQTVVPAVHGLLPGGIRNLASNSTEMFFDHINIDFQHAVFYPSGTTSGTISGISYGVFVPQGGADTNVLVQDCNLNHLRFGNNNYYSYGYTQGTNHIFRGNTFSNYFARLEFVFMDYLLVENNTFTRSGVFPPVDYGGDTTCGGFEGFGSNIVVLDNTFNTDGTKLPYYNDGETIMCQSQTILNTPSSVTASGSESMSTATLFYPATTSGSDAYKDEVVVITSGSCAGEWGEITANNGTRFTITPAWSVIPPAGSQFQIIPGNTYLWSTVSSAGSNTLTDTTQSWPTNMMSGTTNGVNVVAIINGPGMGQMRDIVANNGTTLTISGTWNEPPGAGSTYAVTTSSANRWLVKGNTLSAVPRGIVFYSGGHDSVIADNTLTNTGETIYLRGDQRPVLGTATYDRFNPIWNVLVADNVLVHNASGTYSYQNCYGDTTFQVTGSGTVNGQNLSIVGTESLGVEFRRNVQQSILVGGTANGRDGSTVEYEGYADDVGWRSTLGTYVDKLPGKLATLFDDNVSINTVYPYRLTTGDYQDTIWDAAAYYPATSGTLVLNGTLNGATTGPTNSGTGSAGYNCFLDAAFSGTGASTGLGGTGANFVEEGSTAAWSPGSGQNSLTISSGTGSFVPGVGGSGPYLTSVTGTTGSSAYLLLTPPTPRDSWGRIFDSRNIIFTGTTYQSGMWLVNGGFDIFWRPAATPSGNSMRVIDIGNGDSVHGLRLTFHTYTGSNTLIHEILTGTNGGGVSLTGTYTSGTSGFQAGQIYHIGVTYSTDETTGVTTERIFAAPGTGAIVTGSSSPNLIRTGTFTLKPDVVTNAGGYLSGASWTFCSSYPVAGKVSTNDYDGFRMYYSDPGTFPQLVTPDP